MALIFALALAVWPGLSSAQTLPEAVEQLPDQLLRQQEDQRRAVDRERLRREMLPPEDAPPAPVPPEAETPRCVDVQTIRLEGMTRLDPAAYAWVTRPSVGACLSVADMTALAERLSEALAADGYITTRVLLSPQSLENGVVTLRIEEGFVESILLIDGDQVREGTFLTALAFPTGAGQLLRLRDIEQGLDQINRLGSYDARVQLRPGQTATQSRVAVSVVREEGPLAPVHGSIGRDNNGSETTGQWRHTADLRMDNALGLGEALQLGGTRSLRAERDRRAESLSWSVSVPLGYWTLFADGSWYRYATLVEGGIEDFHLDGTSTTNRAGLTWIVHRGSQSKTRLGADVTLRRTRAYLEDVLIETNSRKLTTGRLSLVHSTRLLGGVAFAELGYMKGLGLLGAIEDDPGQADSVPTSRFDLVDVALSWDRPFALGDQALSWNTSLYGWTSPDTLYGSVRPAVTGSSSVRGFGDASLAGDRGGYVRGDLVWTFALPEAGLIPLDGFDLFAGLDGGWIKKDRVEPGEGGTVASTSLGVRLGSGILGGDLRYSRALRWDEAAAPPNQEVSGQVLLRF